MIFPVVGCEWLSEEEEEGGGGGRGYEHTKFFPFVRELKNERENTGDRVSSRPWICCIMYFGSLQDHQAASDRMSVEKNRLLVLTVTAPLIVG